MRFHKSSKCKFISFAARPGFQRPPGSTSNPKLHLSPVPTTEQGLLPSDYVLEDPDSHFIYICRKMGDEWLTGLFIKRWASRKVCNKQSVIMFIIAGCNIKLVVRWLYDVKYFVLFAVALLVGFFFSFLFYSFIFIQLLIWWRKHE